MIASEQAQVDQNGSRARRAVRVVPITVLNRTYTLGRVPPLEVIGIGRRLAPFMRPLIAFGLSIEKLRKPEGEDAPAVEGMSRLEMYNHLADAGGPILDALAQMSEPDQNYVIAACLRVTYDPTNKISPEMWDATTDRPVSQATAGEVLALTVEQLKLILPELWSELGEVRNSFAGMLTAATGGARAA
ncbi:hypothetical protein SAMN05216360_12534 [Methylobacterium phyllostachyos]|uniref:Phage tail assembly chaperone protein, TAC n=1 Tax=Methylobacterium phyllostachyos TaxID=582672 RepID=A0A1H0K861_9HYPH|nr:hypothetical protein [Methylobacterium phyllostachyos]SDO51983.1 hypothetical protein SAMN05216360_12534 [Methylobacterium phyllostachyos]